MTFDKKRMQELSGIEPDELPKRLSEGKKSLNESASHKKRFFGAKTVLNESASRKQEVLLEEKIRREIRKEIQSIIDEAIESGDTDWLYKGTPGGIPRKNKSGMVTLGFLGLGFK